MFFFFRTARYLFQELPKKFLLPSNPPGAKIIVDGKEQGYTPLNLELKKKKSQIIRIEKQGYNPIEVRVTRKTSVPLATMSLLRIVIATSASGMIVGVIYAIVIGLYWMIRGFEGGVEAKT